MSKFANGWPSDVSIDSLDEEMLEELSGCRGYMVVSFLERNSKFDAHKIGVLLALGALKANELLADIHPTATFLTGLPYMTVPTMKAIKVSTLQSTNPGLSMCFAIAITQA